MHQNLNLKIETEKAFLQNIKNKEIGGCRL